MIRKIIIAVFLISALSLLIVGCPKSSTTSSSDAGDESSTGPPPPDEGTEAGFTAPDFQLQNLAGEIVSLGGLRGHPVIINFWATWCGWCVIEMPHLQAVYEEHAGEGLVLLAINIGESQDKVASFKQSNNLTFTMLLDSQEAVTLKYDVTGYPTTFFIDKDGIIRAKKLGAFLSKEGIERGLDEIMP